MFSQIIRANVVDPVALHRAMEEWQGDLRFGAGGFLGSTGGITDNGEFLSLTWFDSQDDARANSARPERKAWWDRVERALSDIELIDCGSTYVAHGGGFDEAGAVQAMRYKVVYGDALAHTMENQASFDNLMNECPGMLGAIVAGGDDGEETAFIHFKRGVTFREDWRDHMPPAFKEVWRQVQKFAILWPFANIRDPWVATAD